jgi:5-methyltetrahydrofolate--homocysteine methyltransferase
VLTRPDVIADIHGEYLAAGADIIETNTFNATRIAMADYGLEDLAREINVAGARWPARWPTRHGRPRQAAFRRRRARARPTAPRRSRRTSTTRASQHRLRHLVAAYAESARADRGRRDLLMVETVFDTLNAKAAMFAIRQVFDGATASSCR